MARPRTDETGRTERVYVRLTPAEAAVLSDRAASAGMSLSDYVRHHALGGEAKRVRRPAMSGDIAALVRQLAAVGNNLNQLVREMHASQTPPLPPVLDHACAEVVRIIKELGA